MNVRRFAARTARMSAGGIVVLCLAALSLHGCLFSSDDGNTRDYFPLDVGNAWYYTTGSGPDTARVTPGATIDGVAYNGIDLAGGSVFETLRMARKSTDGIEVYVGDVVDKIAAAIVAAVPTLGELPADLDINLPDDEWLFIKEPLRGGMQWRSTEFSLAYTAESGQVTAEIAIDQAAVAETLTLPAGTFETIRVDMVATGVATVQVGVVGTIPYQIPPVAVGSVWYAANVGPVKFATQVETAELLSYSLVQAAP